MMLHNLAAEVKTNLAFDDKKFACLRKPFATSFVTPAENAISTNFSANTEDVSFSEIQSFEANFLGKGEVFLEKSDDFSLNRNPSSSIYDFTSIHSSQSSKCATNKAAFNKFKFSNQSVHSNSLLSVLRCLADQGLIANDNDLASSISNLAPNLSRITNLPDEPPGNMPLSSSALNYQSNFDPVNQVRYCPSRSCTQVSSDLLTTGGSLNSEASSDHLLKMINCLIEEAEVSKMAEKARGEELLLLKKEVDHLKQASHAILMYLDAMQKSGQKLQQVF